MKKLTIIAAAFAAFAADAAITITGVTARQRWPWNSLVDVEFTISGAAVGEAFAIDINAEYAGGEKKLAAYTYTTEPVVAGSATHRLTWDMGKDYPDFRAEDLRVSVTATPFSSSTPVYMVIDLSGGKDAATYPVRYTTTPPAHVQGAIDEPCQTTELWMRRIPAAGQTFSTSWRVPSADTSNTAFWTKLTKDFYIAVFETTQQQWFQINGDWPSTFSNETYRASRPLDSYYPKLLFGSGGCTWSDENRTIADNCLLQTLRSRTGLATLNLPTDAQWQFAACAGTITTPERSAGEVYRYGGYSVDEIARYSGNQSAAYNDGLCDTNSGSACVGSYKPNAFGLYDMLGNVSEDVLNRFVSETKLKQYYVDNGTEFPLVDPQGLSPTLANSINGSNGMTRRGANFSVSSGNVTLWRRDLGALNYPNDGAYKVRGFRFCVTCE